MSHVSVVIPLFNDPNALPRAVASAMEQSFLGEIIIVNDASTDDSLSVAQELARNNPAIKVICAPSNRGPAAARNQGARQARFEYLSFLDSDDELLDGYFADVIVFLDGHPEMSAAKVGMEFQDPVKGNVLPDFDPRYPAVVFSSPCNVIIRRSSFLDLGGFSENPAFRTKHGGEDVAFSQAVAEYLAPLAKIDTVYYRCWSRAGSHLDQFLANTRLAKNEDGFEFVNLSPEQRAGGALSQALDEYMAQVRSNLGLPSTDS